MIINHYSAPPVCSFMFFPTYIDGDLKDYRAKWKEFRPLYGHIEESCSTDPNDAPETRL